MYQPNENENDQNQNLSCPACQGTSYRIHGYSRPVLCLKGQRRQRYRCNGCEATWSENYYKFHYRLRHPDPALNSKIFRLIVHGLSQRAISRLLDISEHSVRIRVNRMAQRALDFQSDLTKNLSICEEVCFDGLENFAATQYDPNNIHQAIGRDSLFIYDFNFAPLNRKGRMSEWQKNRLAEIVAASGRYNPKAVKVATGEILKRLLSKSPEKLTLLTDEHFHYKEAIRELKSNIEHVTISSKACRNFQNILFSVNHADLLIRKSMGAFARETISFSKSAGRMCQKFALFMVYKNFMSAQFTKAHVRRQKAHRESPAQSLGLCSKRLNFSDIFSTRSLSPLRLNPEWKFFWNAQVPPHFQRSLAYA